MKIRGICFYLGALVLTMSFSFFFLSYQFYCTTKVIFLEWEIISLSSFSSVLLFLLDWMSTSFIGVVFLISSMVLFYSHSYMSGDPNLIKFIYLVFLFVMSMLLMILSPNLVSILLGWDGLGLVSYCLVIYYQNVKSSNAGMLTILSNRVGDVAILLAVCWALNFGSFNIFMLTKMFSNKILLGLLTLVIMAAATKSAQIPFSAWLPAAMAAPTPVSALVHSSTLVTAGVYLLIRFSGLMNTNFVLFVVAVLTMLMSGVGAMYEMDLKKIIALSTLSQLGVMMMILSLGMEELSYFHLLSHALFKSLLFLCAGFYIHSIGDCQDIRLLGSLWVSSPVVSVYFMGASISLCGFPFLSGFYSKDLVLEFFFMPQMNSFILVLIYTSTILTFMYSIRLIMYAYLGGLKFKVMLNKLDNNEMFIPMMVLFFFSVVGGAAMFWAFFPSVFIYISPPMKMLISLGLLISGVFIITKKSKKFNTMTHFLYFYSMMWGLPFFFTSSTMKILTMGLANIRAIDHGWLEFFSGMGGIKALKISGYTTDKINLIFFKNFLFFFFFLVTTTLMIY